MKIALAQINTTVGDIDGNCSLILEAYKRGVAAGAEIVVVPELAITGYPPRDLLLKAHFIHRNLEALALLAKATGETALLVGYVGRSLKDHGRALTNSVAVLQRGEIVGHRDKTLLPTYDVFDEDRYFEPAHQNLPIEINGRPIGVTICEDLWNEEEFCRERRYASKPPEALVEAGAEMILNLSASPWNLEKDRVRTRMLSGIAKRNRVPVVYCNLVGGNDELVFDGNSLAFDRSGALIAKGAAFAEDFIVVDTEAAEDIKDAPVPDEELLHGALVLGLRDYLQKCGFKSAVLGLSGGIDSAVVACLAVDALGAENVRGFSLPSQYSSQHSLDDARDLAEHLGIGYDVIRIEEGFGAMGRGLAPVFEGLAEDTTEENIQARLRGVIMMAISNKFGSLLLTTGNKSELAVGYCTLYGDMCGGLAVINDVPKTLVYRLARWINRDREIIPESTIVKPPSAELRPDQKDQDSLPDYEVLDAILRAYVVEHKSAREIIDTGLDRETVERIIRLIDLNEYKRRQSAPGLKVTSKAFGVGRRMPVAQRFREA